GRPGRATSARASSDPTAPADRSHQRPDAFRGAPGRRRPPGWPFPADRLMAMSVPRRIYVDHASTTPLAPEVLQAMLPHLGERFGNASSLHSRGLAAREAVEQARESVAALLGVPVDQILFTSSASESNNLALKGTAMAAGSRKGHLLAT